MQKRTSKPGAGNKYYITLANGGYSRCIVGSPKDKNCNVLANCVGYACGRFNEIIGSMKYPKLNCNAENFIERAKKLGLKVVSYPTLGGIMVWQKGNSLNSSDGAGHVEVVEEIYNNNSIYTSASNYGGTSFYNAKRNNNNGRWGLGSGYKFRGCIINPSIGDVHYEKPQPTPTPQPSPTPKADILTLVKKTIRGDFGNGQARKKALGANYNEVQRQVNLNIKHKTTKWNNIKLY